MPSKLDYTLFLSILTFILDKPDHVIDSKDSNSSFSCKLMNNSKQFCSDSCIASCSLRSATDNMQLNTYLNNFHFAHCRLNDSSIQVVSNFTFQKIQTHAGKKKRANKIVILRNRKDINAGSRTIIVLVRKQKSTSFHILLMHLHYVRKL